MGIEDEIQRTLAEHAGRQASELDAFREAERTRQELSTAWSALIEEAARAYRGSGLPTEKVKLGRFKKDDIWSGTISPNRAGTHYVLGDRALSETLKRIGTHPDWLSSALQRFPVAKAYRRGGFQGSWGWSKIGHYVPATFAPLVTHISSNRDAEYVTEVSLVDGRIRLGGRDAEEAIGTSIATQIVQHAAQR